MGSKITPDTFNEWPVATARAFQDHLWSEKLLWHTAASTVAETGHAVGLQAKEKLSMVILSLP
jgi:hypothetical protein